MFGNYDIDEFGVVTNTKTGKILKAYDNGAGYMYVDIRIDRKKKRIYLHRMLALKFIPNPDKKKYVNHIDGDKSNNSIGNLEWVTNGENMKHAYKSGLSKPVINTILNGKRDGDMRKYKTTPILRANFKRCCIRRGLSIDDFEEVYSGEKIGYNKKFYYELKK